MGLAEILAQKRAELAMPKPSVALYLALYSKAPRIFYLDYFENFQYLIHWLGLPVPSTTQFDPIPPLLGSYSVQEIARYLGVSQEEVFWTAYNLV